LSANKNSDTRREMRHFGLIMAGGLAAVSMLLRWRGHAQGVWQYILIAAIVFLALSFIYPPALRIIHKPWMLLGAAMGWFNTRLILTVVFICVFTPMALVLRLIRKDLLNAGWNQKSESYWLPPRDPEPKKERYERMS
jgi:hypothetical protein